MQTYRRRTADTILQKKLASTGAVLIEGAKWCGKTTTAGQIARSILYMQDPSSKQQNLEMAEINPGLLLQGNTPRLIDEWQLAPKLWDDFPAVNAPDESARVWRQQRRSLPKRAV